MKPITIERRGAGQTRRKRQGVHLRERVRLAVIAKANTFRPSECFKPFFAACGFPGFSLTAYRGISCALQNSTASSSKGRVPFSLLV